MTVVIYYHRSDLLSVAFLVWQGPLGCGTFPIFPGCFPICHGALRGSSRFVLFLFLSLSTAPGRKGLRRNLDKKWETLWPAFGRTDFSRIFIFQPPDFFVDSVAGFFLLIFVGKSAQKKSSRKIPGKILQNLYNKNSPTHFCRLAGARNPPVWNPPGLASPKAGGV